MYEVFSKFCDIDELGIPSRRDIGGRRYGFVRVFHMKDDKFLDIKLDNIIRKGGRFLSIVLGFKEEWLKSSTGTSIRGANMCLLEKREQVKIVDLLANGKDWLKQ